MWSLQRRLPLLSLVELRTGIEGTHLKDAAKKVGLDFEFMEEAIANGNHADEIEDNHTLLRA